MSYSQLDALFYLFVLYFIPAIVGLSRSHQHRLPIALLNIFLGWTFVGWVVALVWAAMPVAPVNHRASK